VQLAEKHINDAGGINGRELSVTTDMPLSEAIIGGVPALGPTRSTDVMDVSDATKVFPIPIAIGGTNVDLLQGNPGLFRCRPDDSLVANAIVNYIKGDMKLTRLGILYDSDIFGTGGAHLVEQGCNNNELTIVRKETYTAGDKNYLAKLDSLRGAGIEVMVVYGTDPEDVAEIQKKYRSLGSPPPYEYIGSPSSGMRACLDLSGNDAEDLIVIADYVPGRPAIQKYANEYRGRYNEDMDPTAAWYYDALKILGMAVGEVRRGPQAIIRAIRKIQNYEGVLGTYDFTADGNGLHKVSVVRIKNGGHELIK
jgi:branched-chain amino acid transport system substrate-binding protein